MILLSLLSRPSLAQDLDCTELLGEFELRAMVQRSSESVFADNPTEHRRIYDELLSRVPCLDHQLPKDAWAELSLNEAIVRHATRSDWQQVLSRALGIYPDLEDVPKYLLDAWMRPRAPEPSSSPVPDDAALFIDGVLVPRAPVIAGEHIAQVWRDGRWQSAVVDEARPIPSSWLAPKPKEFIEIEKPTREWDPTGRGGIGVGFGVWSSSQLVEDGGSYLPDANALGGGALLGLRAAQPISGFAGLFFDGILRIAAPSVRRIDGSPSFDTSPEVLPALYTGPAIVRENVHAGIGFGALALQTVEGGMALTRFFPQPHLAIGSRQGRASFELGFGGTPAAAHGAVRGGWVLSEPGPISTQFGFDSTLDFAWFSEEPPGDRNATVMQIAVAGRIDLVWGADR